MLADNLPIGQQACYIYFSCTHTHTRIHSLSLSLAYFGSEQMISQIFIFILKKVRWIKKLLDVYGTKSGGEVRLHLRTP